MQARELTISLERTCVVGLDDAEEVIESLLSFARENGVTDGRLPALGAFSDAVIGVFDSASKDYVRTRLDEQVEVASMVGDFALHGAELKLHPHAVLSKRDCCAWGGELLKGHEHPTLEVITVAPDNLQHRTDEPTGLPLIDTGTR